MPRIEQNQEAAGRKTEFQIRLQKLEEQSGLTDADLENLPQEERYQRLERVIGNTPLRAVQLPGNNLLLQKDETANPTETHYDRCYLQLLRNLEQTGVIRHGDTLLETTSGSAGISFAWMCRKLGFKAVVFLPSYVPQPRIIEIANLADEVHLNDDRVKYLKGCSEEMVMYLKANRERVKAMGHKIWMPNHSQNFATPQAFSMAASEVLQQYQGANIDYFIGGIGNGSTLLGNGEVLKRHYPNLKVLAYEPKDACPYYKKYKEKWGSVAPDFMEGAEVPDTFSFHSLPGTGGYGNIDFPFVERAIETGIIDDVFPVPDQKILETATTHNDGQPPELQFGNTSLVSRFVAEKLAQGVTDKTMLILAYDRADRYGEPRYV